MIEFSQVTVSDNNLVLLEDITFALKKTEKLLLSGPSGSGKSTLLLTLLGVYVPDQGSIRVNDTPVSSQTICEIRNMLAYVPQEPVLGAESVLDALMLPFQYKVNYKRKPETETLINVLDSVKLDAGIMEKDASVISGGEKQRLAIARSLLLGKTVFLLDEVTSALDPESKQAVLNLFSHHDYTVLAVSHDPEWSSICQRTMILQNGCIEEIM